jgi:hypothetical protein
MLADGTGGTGATGATGGADVTGGTASSRGSFLWQDGIPARSAAATTKSARACLFSRLDIILPAGAMGSREPGFVPQGEARRWPAR